MDNFFKLFVLVLLFNAVLSQDSSNISFYESEDFDDPLNGFFLNVRGPADAIVDVENIINNAVPDKTYVDLSTFGVTSMEFDSIITAEHGGQLSPFVQLECDGTCITNSADFHEGGMVIKFFERIAGIQLFTFTGNPNEIIRVYEYETDELVATYELNGDSESNDFQFTGIYDNSFNGIGSIEIDGSYWALYYVAIWDMGPKITMIEWQLNLDGNWIDITEEDIMDLSIDEGTSVQIRLTAEDPLGNHNAITYHSVLTDVQNNPPHDGFTPIIYVTTQQSINQGVINIDVDLTSSDGNGITSMQFIINVNNVAPTMVFDQDQNVREGEIGAISFSINDPGLLDTHTYSISPLPPNTDPSDFVCSDPLFCNRPEGSNAISFDASNVDGPSTRTYCGYVMDEVERGPTVCAEILIENQPPVPFLPEAFFDEGYFSSDRVVEITGTNVDPYNPEENLAVYTWDVPGASDITYGNPTSRNPAIITFPEYTQDVEYAIYLSVTDKDGAQSLFENRSEGLITIYGTGSGGPGDGGPGDGGPGDGGPGDGGPGDGGPGDGGPGDGGPGDGGPSDPTNPSEPSTNGYVCYDVSGSLGFGTVVFDMCSDIQPITPVTWDQGDPQDPAYGDFTCQVESETNSYLILKEPIAHKDLQEYWSACFSFHLSEDFGCVMGEGFGFGIEFVLLENLQEYERSDSQSPSQFGANFDNTFSGLAFSSGQEDCGDENLQISLFDNQFHYVVSQYDTFELPISADPATYDTSNEYFVTMTHTPDYLKIVVANDSSGASFGNSATKIFDTTYIFADGDSFSERIRGSNQQDIFIVLSSATNDEIGIPVVFTEFSFHDDTP